MPCYLADAYVRVVILYPITRAVHTGIARRNNSVPLDYAIWFSLPRTPVWTKQSEQADQSLAIYLKWFWEPLRTKPPLLSDSNSAWY